MGKNRSLILRHIVAAGLFLIVLPTVHGQAEDPSAGSLLTLEQALAQAAQNSRDMQIALLEVEKAKGQTRAARTRYYPAISLDFLGAMQLVPIDFLFRQGVFGKLNGSDVPSKDIAITTPRTPTGIMMSGIGQPISQLYRIRLGVQTLRKGEEVSAQDSRIKLQELVKKVKLNYWSIAQAQNGIRSLEEQLRLFRELDRLTGEYLAREVVLRADALQVKARLAQAEYNLQVLRDSMLSAKESLNFLLGRNPLEGFTVEEVPAATVLEIDPEAARRKALAQRAEPAKARAQLEQAELDRKAKKAEYIPDVAGSLQYNHLLNYNEMLPTQMSGLGLQFKWEVYDWGRRKHELASKDKTIAQARLAQQAASDAVLLEVNDKYRKLRQNRLLLESVRLAREAAAESLRVVSEKYKREAVLVKDVLKAQADLEEAGAQYRNAVISFWTARAEFEKALGEEK